MRLLTEQHATIACSVDAAYRYTTNLERFGEWFPGVISIVSADALPQGTVGKQYLETLSVPLRGREEVRITVKEARADELFITEGSFAPLMPRMEVRFRATGPSTCEVTWRMGSRNDGLLARVLLLPLASREITKRAKRAMARLRSNLETSPAS